MEGRLKILMTADTVGGVWTYAVDLCKALANYNTEVHLMTMGALLNKEQNRQVQQLGNIHLYESNYKLEWMPDSAQDAELAGQWVASVYEKVKPDIIHFNNYGQTAAQKWDCPVLTVYHSCVLTWWQAVKGEQAPQEWDSYKNTVKNAIKASDVIVAPSAGMLAQAEKEFGKFPGAVVIYNGRDVKPIVSGKEPYILSAGRIWDEAKNISLLSRIAQRLSWPVYISGDNVNPGTGIAPELENVHFTGKLSADEMQECMNRAAVFVMPAKYEPFGLAVLEAAKAGCALALGNIETLREIWGDAAVYFNPDDEAGAATTLQKLIEDAGFRKEMAQKASARAKDFTAGAMSGNYMKLYQKLLAERQIKL